MTTIVTRAMDSNKKLSELSTLLRLPLEIRHQIYEFSLWNSRSPSAETIYLSRLPSDWRDPASPLLLVNGQVHDEIIKWIQTYPIHLRVTHQGVHFSSIAETCFIAQRHRPRDYSKISHLVVEIWPPHPDRPVDMIHIWRHLRKIRAELRDIPPLKQISFLFSDNETAKWTLDGKPLDVLKSRSSRSHSFLGRGVDDLTTIMDLFTRVRVAKATFHMPHGLAPGKTTESFHDFLQTTNAMMMGRIPIDEDVYDDEDEEVASYQDWADEECEEKLEKKGAEIARDKLDAMPYPAPAYIVDPERRMELSEWDDFIKIWSPKFWLVRDKRFRNEGAWKEYYTKLYYHESPYDSDYM